MFSALVKFRKKGFCIVLVGKQQKWLDSAPLQDFLLREAAEQILQFLRLIRKASKYCQKETTCFYSSLCVCKMCLQHVRLKYFSAPLKLQKPTDLTVFCFLLFRSQWSPLCYLVAVHHVNSFVFQRVDPAVSLALSSFLRDHIYRNFVSPTSFPNIERRGPGNQVGIPYPCPLGGTPAAVFG